MSEFSKQFNLWHIVNDKKYRTATLYRKALCKKFRNWKSPEDYSELSQEVRTLTVENEKLKADKQLVVVPKFVDDAIRSLSNGVRGAFDAIYLIKSKVEQYRESNSDWAEVYDWIFEHGNSTIFERAFMDGYTVEKEKLYLLKHIDICKTDKDHDWFMIKHSDGPLNHLRVEKGHNPTTIDCRFTQSEIDDMETGSYEQIEAMDV